MTLDFLSRFPLPDYRTALGVGVLLGAALGVWVGRRNGLAAAVVLDGVLAAALGGLLIGRAVYVGANLAYFREYPERALALWQGGLSAPGVIIGGMVSAGILARVRRVDPHSIWDALAPGAAVVLIAAYLGCVRAGCACGKETWPDQQLLWSLSAELPDLYGLRAPRVAVQVLGTGLGGGMLALTLWATASGATTRVAPAGPAWLLLYGLGEFALGFLRGDALPAVGPLSALQVAGLWIALAGGCMALLRSALQRTR